MTTSSTKVKTVKWAFRLSLALGLLTILLNINRSLSETSKQLSTSCWVWNKIELSSLHQCQSLLLYQGDISIDSGKPHFIKRGFNPFRGGAPKPISIVIRLSDLVPTDFVHYQVLYLVKQWGARGVEIKELQIDFDSPSTKLDQYVDFIRELKTKLPNLTLSVTALGSWIYDNPIQLKRLGQSVDYIAMQLYQSYKPHRKHIPMARDIAKMGFNYKLGITPSRDFDIEKLQQGANSRGYIIFIN